MSQDTDPAVITSLQRIVELEMAGVVRFAHYALMVTGPHGSRSSSSSTPRPSSPSSTLSEPARS